MSTAAVAAELECATGHDEGLGSEACLQLEALAMEREVELLLMGVEALARAEARKAFEVVQVPDMASTYEYASAEARTRGCQGNCL